MIRSGVSRRDLLKNSAAAAGAVALGAIAPSRVLGANDRIQFGVIGVGGMGRGHIPYEGTKVVAVCDVDTEHLKTAMDMIGGGVRGYADFRELIAQPDIDGALVGGASIVVDEFSAIIRYQKHVGV